MTIRQGHLDLDGASLRGENPLPIFCDLPADRYIAPDATMDDADCALLGVATGRRVLPYRMQDRYGREKAPMRLATIVMENDRLRATFLPGYGGRLYSLYDKQRGRELFFANPVFQPANLAQRNAWVSGGVEWNVGHYGHAAQTLEPLFAAVVDDGAGSPFLRFFEFERTTCVFFQIDAHLEEDSDVLAVHVRIANHNDVPVPGYWWTNCAVALTARTRVLAGVSRVLYAIPGTQPDAVQPHFAVGQLPYLPCAPSTEASFPASIPFAHEYFFQYPDGTAQPWEAAWDGDGHLTFDVSTTALRYRKMFCWGDQPGGHHWMDFLSAPGRGDYAEIQAGLAPTQLHGHLIPAHEVVDFTQLFGCAQTNPARVLDDDWQAASDHVGRIIGGLVGPHALAERHARYQRDAQREIGELIAFGSGWGALERRRLERSGRSVPAGLAFPDETLGAPQQPWLALLETGDLPVPDGDMPASWMVQRPWVDLLAQSLADPAHRNWASLLHLGVMLRELGDRDGATRCFGDSLAERATPVGLRNLARCWAETGHLDRAIALMRQAHDLHGGFDDPAFDEELLELLARAGLHDQVWAYVEALPNAARQLGPIQLRVAESAVALGKNEFLEEFFDNEYPTLRESETTLTDLWRLHMARQADPECPLDQLVVDATLAPPPRIDFTTDAPAAASGTCPA